MSVAKSTFFDFIRVVVTGSVDEVLRHLENSPLLATATSDVGATLRLPTSVSSSDT